MTTGGLVDQPDHQQESRSSFPALTIDWDLYGRHLEGSDLSEADKRLFIETLWSIMVSFVDLGFRLGPVSESFGDAGPPHPHASIAAVSAPDDKDATTTHAFEGAAANAPASSSQRRPDAS